MNILTQIYPSRERELQSQVNFLEQRSYNNFFPCFVCFFFGLRFDSKVEMRCVIEFFSVEILVEEVKRRKEINDQVRKGLKTNE